MTSPVTADEDAREVAAEQPAREAALVERVLRFFRRLRGPAAAGQLMQALVRHLHAFLREVRLTEEEWATAIEFLTDAGHITDDTRQEFILLSDVLGASMQTITINNAGPRQRHRGNRLRPVLRRGRRPTIEIGGDIAFGAAGEPCWVEGTVTDTDGNPLAGARIEVWEADEDGFYDVQYDDDRTPRRAHICSPTPTAVTLLGTDTRRRTRSRTTARSGRMLGGDRALTDARIASALHGHSTRLSHAGDAHLRARRRTAGLRHRVRGQGLADQGLRRAAAWYTGAEWARPVRIGMVESSIRHRAGAA